MGPTFCPFAVILVLLHVASTASRILITPAPHSLIPSSATKGFNAKHAALLDQRGFQECDGGHGVFTCQTGTCYSGADSYVRCCYISICAPRTIRFEYSNPAGSICVDKDTNGCLSCPNLARGMCYTNLNIENYQYAIHCNSVGGIFTTSSMNTVTGDSTSMAAVSTTFVTETDTTTVSASPAMSSDSLDSGSDNPANAPSFGLDGSSAQSTSIAGAINPSNLPSIIPATSASSTARTDSSNSKLPRGAIVGIAIGSGLTCIFLVTTTMLLLLRQQCKNEVVNSSSIQLKKIPAYDQNTPRNSDLDNTMVESISPRSPREPWSLTSLNSHPMSPEVDSREVSTTSELDPTSVSPITSRVLSTIAGYLSTTTYPSSSVGSRGYGQALPSQLTSGLRDGQLHQSNFQLSFFVRSNPTGSPVSPVFPHASIPKANEHSYGGTSMSDPPKSPSFTYNAQKPQIPTTISRHSSRMTSNGAGPYLTADRALGDGY